jgi:hypothetical protein
MSTAPLPSAAPSSPAAEGDGSDEDDIWAESDEEHEEPSGTPTALYEAYFHTPREGASAAVFGSLKTRLVRLTDQKLTMHKSETARPELTVWLKHVTEATLQRVEGDEEAMPFRLLLTTPWRTLKLLSEGASAKILLDHLVSATEHEAGRGTGRLGQPLGLQTAVLHYSRYADAAAAAGGRKADQLLDGVAAGQVWASPRVRRVRWALAPTLAVSHSLR